MIQEMLLRSLLFKGAAFIFSPKCIRKAHVLAWRQNTCAARWLPGHVTPLLLRRPTNGSAPIASRLFLSAALTRARSQTAPEFRHRKTKLGARCRLPRRPARNADTRCTRTHTYTRPGLIKLRSAL